MDSGNARQTGERYLITHPRVEDPVVTRVEEQAQAFVVFWTTQRHLDTGDPADSQGPGTGPLAVPKDGSEPRYLGSQRLDVALHEAGLGPAPSPDTQADSWGF